MDQHYQSQKVEYNNKDEMLEYLMRRFGDKVMHLAYSYLCDRDEAEDAAQEVFLRAYKALDKFRGNSSPFTWIYKITVNFCRDRLKRRQFVQWEYLDDERLTLVQNDPEQQLMQSLEGRMLFEAILELPVAYRETIILHYLNELRVKEVAEVTGISVSLAKIRLYRGRKKLQKILEEKGVNYGS